MKARPRGDEQHAVRQRRPDSGQSVGGLCRQNQSAQTGQIHPVFKAMNLLEYDAAGFGNHEFNYGLEFLDRSLKGSAFLT